MNCICMSAVKQAELPMQSLAGVNYKSRGGDSYGGATEDATEPETKD